MTTEVVFVLHSGNQLEFHTPARSVISKELSKDFCLDNGGQIFEPQRPQSFYTEFTEKSPCLWCFFLRELCGLSVLKFYATEKSHSDGRFASLRLCSG